MRSSDAFGLVSGVGWVSDGRAVSKMSLRGEILRCSDIFSILEGRLAAKVYG